MSKVIVLGAGPAGLAAAYTLAKFGKRPLVVERSEAAGGLMRGIKRGDFEIDLGRKELYARIPDVFELWEELLGPDFVPYPHRVGILFEGTIIERTSSFRGPLRGMKYSLAARCLADFVGARLARPFAPSPSNLEEYWHGERGGSLARMLTQGFSEKFYGKKWREQPVPQSDQEDQLGSTRTDRSVIGSAKALFRRARHDPDEPRPWRHPAKGTGQIIQALESAIIRLGGRFSYRTNVQAVCLEKQRVTSVVLTKEGRNESIPVHHLVSAIPVMSMAKLLGIETPELQRADHNRKRLTLLLYVFLNEPPRFEHAWLDVSCPKMTTGRITNYAKFNGRMVPDGKTCLAVEVFTSEGDDILSLTDEGVIERLLSEVSTARLINRDRVFDRMLLRIPGAEASNEFQTWESPAFRDLISRLGSYENLYEINRAGTDIATYAGLEAARAIATEDRRRFDERADPSAAYSITSAQHRQN